VTAQPGESKSLPWGDSRSTAFILQRKTIKLDGKPDSWEGIDPIFEGSVSGGGILAPPGYSIEKVFICRNEKSLYWRINFQETNPFAKLPKGIKDSLVARLTIDIGNDRAIELDYIYKLQKSEHYSNAGIWDDRSKVWTNIAGDAFSEKNSPAMFVASVPISLIGKYLKGILDFRIVIYHTNANGWEPGKIECPNCYIDFSK